jgi:hypothetical protein
MKEEMKIKEDIWKKKKSSILKRVEGVNKKRKEE